jgi:predicted peptidase
MTTGVLFGCLALGSVLIGAGRASADNPSEPLTGQHPQSFEKRIRMTVKSNYLLYLPDEYQKSKTRWPLILFLHGAGQRGNDLVKLEAHGLPKLIAKEGKKYPFIIVSPQCPEDGWWSGVVEINTLNALLDDIVSRYRVDEDRIYLTGLSMGGFGTWRLAIEYPDRFAAIAPVCGKGDTVRAARIAHLPVWVFHGAKDETVPIKESEVMVEAIKKAGGDVKFTVYPEAGHDSWTETYNNPELYEWFLEHKRAKPK